MHERREFNVNLKVTLVGLSWFRTDHFEHALGDDLGLPNT